MPKLLLAGWGAPRSGTIPIQIRASLLLQVPPRTGLVLQGERGISGFWLGGGGLWLSLGLVPVCRGSRGLCALRAARPRSQERVSAALGPDRSGRRDAAPPGSAARPGLELLLGCCWAALALGDGEGMGSKTPREAAGSRVQCDSFWGCTGHSLGSRSLGISFAIYFGMPQVPVMGSPHISTPRAWAGPREDPRQWPSSAPCPSTAPAGTAEPGIPTELPLPSQPPAELWGTQHQARAQGSTGAAGHSAGPRRDPSNPNLWGWVCGGAPGTGRSPDLLSHGCEDCWKGSQLCPGSGAGHLQSQGAWGCPRLPSRSETHGLKQPNLQPGEDSWEAGAPQEEGLRAKGRGEVI